MELIFNVFDWILSFFNVIVIFVAALFILVLVHELGHFLAAKLFGMRVEQFSIGFPPKLFGIRKGETEYCISATPLGGYVKISGMMDETMDASELEEEPKPWEYRSKPVWQRIIVITAGVIFNVILAFFIFTGISYHYGTDRIPVENIPEIYVPEGSTAQEIGFQSGDRIVGINDREIEYVDDGRFFPMSEITRSQLTFQVERDGERITIQTPSDFLDQLSQNPDFITLANTLPSEIGAVQDDMPAAEAGLQPGDNIVSIGGDPIDYYLQVAHRTREADGSVDLTVERNGEQLDFSITPEVAETPQGEQQIIGITHVNPFDYFEVETVEYSLIGAIPAGWNETRETFMGIVNGFYQLFSGQISVRQNLGGPVAIASVTAEATDTAGWLGFWNITAFLSITLAIVNILPIPMLDGGHLMFLIYEGVTRREPSMRVKMALQQIGFVLLIGLMIFVTFNDILRHVVN